MSVIKTFLHVVYAARRFLLKSQQIAQLWKTKRCENWRSLQLRASYPKHYSSAYSAISSTLWYSPGNVNLLLQKAETFTCMHVFHLRPDLASKAPQTFISRYWLSLMLSSWYLSTCSRCGIVTTFTRARASATTGECLAWVTGFTERSVSTPGKAVLAPFSISLSCSVRYSLRNSQPDSRSIPSCKASRKDKLWHCSSKECRFE